MRAFLAIKYYDNIENKNLIEKISKTLNSIDIDTFVFARDVENYKAWEQSAEQLMARAFKEIEKSDILIVEASNPSFGVGIEACYAYMKGIPVYLIANKTAKVSDSIKVISKDIFFYNNVEELTKLKEIIIKP